MGNLQNKEGNGGSFASSLNVPPGNLLEAVARASSEAARIRGEQEKRAATEFDSDEEDYDSDLEDEVRSESKNAGSNDKRGYSEPPDPKYPWLISSRACMECEQEKINVMKQKCKDNYPGMSSSYIDKIKWAEGNYRSLPEKFFIGNILREVIYESSPDEILIQVLMRKRNLKTLLCDNEGMAKIFFDMFASETNFITSDEENDEKSKTPVFCLRTNAPNFIQDKAKNANEKMASYIDWIMNEEDSGTILSPNRNKSDNSLACFFTIKASKDHSLSSDIIEPISSIMKVLPEFKIMHVGPSPLPPKFMTTLLHIDSEAKVGCLPLFSSPHSSQSCNKNVTNTKKDAICASIEIMVGSNVKPDTQSTRKTNGTTSTDQSTILNIYHKERIYAELIQLKRRNIEKTFYVANVREIEKNMNAILPLSFQKQKTLPDGDCFPIIWMSSYFDVCFPRVYEHFRFGKGETLAIRNKVNPPKKTSSPCTKGSVFFDYKIDLLESTLSAIIENRCHLSLADQLCYVLAFTMVITFDSISWMTQSCEANEVFDSFGEMFDDLGTFWKSILKNRDEDIGLGISSENVCHNGDESGSRKALLQLLLFMQGKIQRSYGHLLEENQFIDFGVPEETTKRKESGASTPSTERKRNRKNED